MTDQERAQDMAEQMLADHKMAMGPKGGPFISALQAVIAWLKAQGFSWPKIWSLTAGLFKIFSPYLTNWAGLITDWPAVLAAVLALFGTPPNPLPPPAAPA